MTFQWNLETRKLSSLKINPSNPRKLSNHDYEHLKKSLERFGLIDKPIITHSGYVIGGHQRLSVLEKMKVKEVECWVAAQDLTQQEIDELSIRLNRVHGEFDWDILANSFEEDDLIEWGFSPVDLLTIIPDPEEESPPKAKKKKMCPQCGHEF